MLAEAIEVTGQDFSRTQFPEFFGAHSETVLGEFNAVILELIHEENTSLNRINILREDILDSPYLYLSGPLKLKLGKS